MKIPLRYNFGNIRVRKTGTAMAVVGIGMIVSIVVTMLALVHGLEATFVETGHENLLVILRQGAQNEVNGFFSRSQFPVIRFLPGIARTAGDEPMVIGEVVVVADLPKIDGESSNVTIRGTSDMGFLLRPEVRIVEGRRFEPDLREIIVSRSLSRRFRNMTLNETLQLAQDDWKVVGIFETGGTAYDSEIWAGYSEIAQEWDRPIYSSILVKAESASAAADISRRIENDQRINLQAVPQKKYYADQTSTQRGIRALGYFVAVVLGIGASFAATNMMYGAVMSRSREVATLRALGFRRRSILASFLLESTFLGLLGGIFGCLLALPMNRISTGTANFRTFSEVLFDFRITPWTLLQGLLFAALVGAVGGYLPARRATHIRLIDLMRE